MIPDMIHTPYIAPRISVMAPPLLPISLPAEILSPTVGMRQ